MIRGILHRIIVWALGYQPIVVDTVEISVPGKPDAIFISNPPAGASVPAPPAGAGASAGARR